MLILQLNIIIDPDHFFSFPSTILSKLLCPWLACLIVTRWLLPPKTSHLKRPWCWERLKAGAEGDDRGWDGWMASLDMSLSKLQELVMDRRPGVLQSTGPQRVRHDWMTELNWRHYIVLQCPWQQNKTPGNISFLCPFFCREGHIMLLVES